jgi:hypothetical protein
LTVRFGTGRSHVPKRLAVVGARGAGSLRQLLGDLGAAKRRLLAATEALRDVDTRVRAWDLSELFLARRSHLLRREVAVRFGEALDGLQALLIRLPDASTNVHVAPRAMSGGARNRRLLVAIRGELRYLQRAFDGGNLLLASALATFSDTGRLNHPG